MSASPGGYASKAERAQRAEVIKRLYTEGLALTAIAERLGVHTSTAAHAVTALGLRQPAREKKGT